MEVRVGPLVRTIGADDQFLVFEPDGTIVADRQQGYFVADTRLVSVYTVTLSRVPLVLVSSATIAPFSARCELVNDDLPTADGDIGRGQIHLRLDRTIGNGVHEDYDLTNYALKPAEVTVAVRIESDYADLFDVKGRRYVERGEQYSSWDADVAALTTQYVHEKFRRGLRIRARNFDSRPQFANGAITFRVCLAPRQRWHACLLWEPIADGVEPAAPAYDCRAPLGGDTDHGGHRHGWVDRITNVLTSDPAVNAVLDQAVVDLAAMRISRHDQPGQRGGDEAERWVPAAGIPWYVTLFGRDALVVGLQTLPLSPHLASATLEALGALQGHRYDDRRDEQPGKIPHEIRHGELAALDLIPQTPYYGTHDATPLFVSTAAAVWRWTGDRDLIERIRPSVERALVWIDTDGDLDGDGLQEYRSRAGDWGFYNQGWKDAEDAIVHADGSPAALPIALGELQGYVVAAKRDWAAVVEEALGDAAAARRLRDDAARLTGLLEARFWWEEEGTYYLGLDGHKRPIESVGSNAGHLLWSGAIDPRRAASVVKRLLADDMWSGWGIRTLSARHVAYNPFSYQRGSVWPHDNAIVARGFRRYGYDKEAAQVARAMFDAAIAFDRSQVPELFAGLARDKGAFPAQYLGANVPQAWASGAMVDLITNLVGLDADAPHRQLGVRPALPDWLDHIRLRGLRVGQADIDLVVGRGGVTVEHVRGTLEIIS